MTTGKFVAYLRVSTDKQGKSGLGLEAQRTAITNYLNGGDWELLDEFTEVESGNSNERPQLQAALHRCKLTGATLIIAKLDRLSRNLHFISSLQESKTPFVCADMPQANNFTVAVMAALAQQERELISERTKAALQAAKARGVKLGKPENATPSGRFRGMAASIEARKRLADSFAAQIWPLIREYQGQGMSLGRIAAKLNEGNILTARGKAGRWTATAVKNILARMI